jgi:DNA-binding GntR family transcriptional regulator
MIGANVRPVAEVTLQRKMLREGVKELLLQRIISGVYHPGDRLVETQIARELGVSQTPVREALRDLEATGFVASEPFKGARVREVTPGELAEIYPVRAALEDLAGREAARRLAGRTERLEEEYEAMLAAARADDLFNHVRHDVEFHRLIVEASGNRTLAATWASLQIEVRTFVTALAARDTKLELESLARSHLPILEALRAGDPELAGRALKQHLQTFSDLILKGTNP